MRTVFMRWSQRTPPILTSFWDSLCASYSPLSLPTNVNDLVAASRLIPTVFMPLSLLSYASMIGIISTLSIIGVIFIDGFSKKEAPGSLWSPAETQMGIESWRGLGIAFGLFMAGVSCSNNIVLVHF